jgi:5-(carboxyamino)imidazole ribonucleotide mutase
VPKDAALGGLDSLLSIVQMPPGIPVATVGIDRGRNGAILAIEILALQDYALAEKLQAYREN